MTDLQLKLTNQEVNIVNYLQSKTETAWEELAQFAKNPTLVKKKTIQKAVSDIKRKYQLAGMNAPFNTKFTSLVETKPAAKLDQRLVQVKKTLGGNLVLATNQVHPAHADFVLDRNAHRVRTKFGIHILNNNEWDVFEYIHKNVGRVLTISELRDKVVFPQYGSKLPMRWFDAIMRIINNLRRGVPGLNKRLLTVKGDETSYLFQ